MDQRMKILVVDDDLSIRDLLVAVLTRDGYEAIAAPDGAAALTMLAENPDVVLIVLDWMLPVLDGIGVLAELQEQEDPPPVLMLTAKTSRNDVMQALEAGAKDYVVKPLQKSQLLFKIQNILQQDREGAKARAARRKPIHIAAHAPLTIADISETGVLLESPFPVEKGSIIFLVSESMALRLDVPRTHRFSVRVANVEGKGNKYKLGCEFVGMTPGVTKKIRQVSQASGWQK